MPLLSFVVDKAFATLIQSIQRVTTRTKVLSRLHGKNETFSHNVNITAIMDPALDEIGAHSIPFKIHRAFYAILQWLGGDILAPVYLARMPMAEFSSNVLAEKDEEPIHMKLGFLVNMSVSML
jgi:hypothetical protein